MRSKKIIILPLAVLFISFFLKETEGDNLSTTGFYSSSDEIIEKLNNDSAAYREHFLLGLSFKKKGERKKSIFHFANSCFKYSGITNLKIYPYTVYNYVNGFHIKSEYYNDAVYEIASLFFDYREFEYTIKFIDLMSKSTTALYRDAVILKSNALKESENYDGAVSLLIDLLEQYKDVESRSLIHIRIASVYELKDDYEKAAGEYLNVIRLSLKSWQSGIACYRTLAIGTKYQYELKNNEKLLLAASLINNSKEDSINILENLLTKELDDTIKQDVLKLSLKAYIKFEKHKEAEHLLSQSEQSPIYNTLLKIKADELWANKKKYAAYLIYQKLYTDPAEGIAKESHKRMAQYLIDSNSGGYEKILSDYKDKYPKDKSSELFLWHIAKNKLKDNNNESAVKYMKESLLLFPGGAYSGKNRFWLSKIYTMGGNRNDAEKMIKEMIIINPDSSYTWKKLEELKKKYNTEELKNGFNDSLISRNADNAVFYHMLLYMHDRDAAEKEKRIKAMDFIESVNKYKIFEAALNGLMLTSKFKDNLEKIEKYFEVGYYEGITREIGIIPEKGEARVDLHKMLAYFGGKYNNYYFSVTSMLELLNDYNLKENIMLFSGDTVARLLPAAFSDHVEKAGAETDISKEMAYAVMKAESSFNTRAVSPAGAVGIMQLMPETAKQIARGSKINEYDLKDPYISISFGLKYLSWLNKMFKQDFENIIAGYNAGAGNVKKWIKELNYADKDYFIEFMPFKETTQYVLRANKFFIQYSIISSTGGRNVPFNY